MLGKLTENRAVSFQTVWGTGSDLYMENSAGVNVNNKTAFEIVAFFSAVSLISDSISTLPVDSFIRQDGIRRPFRPRPAWVDQPDVDLTRQGHYGQVLVSLLIDGNAFVRVFRDNQGEIVNLVALDPSTVEVKRNGLGRKIFNVTGEDKSLSSEEILHIVDVIEPGALRGISRVSKLGDALGVASALQQYAARFFGQGATTQGVIEYPGPLTAEQAKQLQQGFDSRHSGFRKAHKTGILSGGAKYVSTQVDNDSAQFLESRRFAVEEIARLYNIPLSLMGIPGTQSYASVEQNQIQFVTNTLRPYVEKLEWAYSKLLPIEAFIKFNTNALQRGDFNSRVSAYSVLTQMGAYSVNEVRALEDYSPVDNGDQHRVPLANIDLNATSIIEQTERVKMAQMLIQVGFSPASVLSNLNLPPIDHTGIPSGQLQQLIQINPENPASAYEV